MTIIGVLIYPNVEVLDFCSRFEIFRNLSHLNRELDVEVATVSQNAEIVNAQGLQVLPTYSFTNAPQFDILVIPGGAGMWLKEQETYREFVQQQYQKLQHLVTVCTGALLIGKMGLLLENMDATTHQEGMEELRKLAPQANIRPFVRFTHTDNIVMTGGISAGIDGALYLVVQQWGIEYAIRIMKYMEYEWKIRSRNVDDPALT